MSQDGEIPPEICTGDGTPIINITFERALCPQHGEIFRHDWPSGYPLFMVEGFKRVVALSQPDLNAAVEVEGDEARAKAIMACLDAKPMCCRLPKPDLLSLLTWINTQHKGKLWPKKPCDRCRDRAHGGPYRTVKSPGEMDVTIEIPHLCLVCVVYRVVRLPGGGPDSQ